MNWTHLLRTLTTQGLNQENPKEYNTHRKIRTNWEIQTSWNKLYEEAPQRGNTPVIAKIYTFTLHYGYPHLFHQDKPAGTVTLIYLEPYTKGILRRPNLVTDVLVLRIHQTYHIYVRAWWLPETTPLPPCRTVQNVLNIDPDYAKRILSPSNIALCVHEILQIAFQLELVVMLHSLHHHLPTVILLFLIAWYTNQWHQHNKEPDSF